MDHKSKTPFLLFAFLLILPQWSHAGVFEIELSGNYRSSQIDKDNYQQSLAASGSLSYYFAELSAIQLSYTKGTTDLYFKTPDGAPKTLLRTNFDFIGLDFVFTIADRQDAFQPYIKLGGAYIVKQLTKYIEGYDPVPVDPQKGVVPSGGVGFKLGITKTFFLKFGVDVWSSPLSQTVRTLDYAGRAGVSMMF